MNNKQLQPFRYIRYGSYQALLDIVHQFSELWFLAKRSTYDCSLRRSLNVLDARLLAIKPPHDLSGRPEPCERVVSGRRQSAATGCFITVFQSSTG